MDRPESHDLTLIAEAPPAPAPAPVQRLDPRVVTLWRLTGSLWTAFLSGAAAIVLLAVEWPLWMVAFVVALGLMWIVEVPSASWRHYAYQVGDVDVRVTHGWWTRRVAVVLHSRIQHVDTRQGPVERALGLATVVIYTAGSVGAMVGIPGLALRDAELLRDLLAQLSGTEDAV